MTGHLHWRKRRYRAANEQGTSHISSCFWCCVNCFIPCILWQGLLSQGFKFCKISFNSVWRKFYNFAFWQDIDKSLTLCAKLSISSIAVLRLCLFAVVPKGWIWGCANQEDWAQMVQGCATSWSYNGVFSHWEEKQGKQNFSGHFLIGRPRRGGYRSNVHDCCFWTKAISIYMLPYKDFSCTMTIVGLLLWFNTIWKSSASVAPKME